MYQGCERLINSKGGKEMTIYEEFVRRVSDGETFYINFKNRAMKIGKKFIIADGVYDQERELINYSFTDIAEILSEIEKLYHNYKYSLPSERIDNKRRKYFKALPIEKIPDDKLIVTTRREVACAKLEGFILCAILSDKLKWTEDIGKWFWQSKNDPDLVILRSWIENN
jgi:hypothetical protein